MILVDYREATSGKGSPGLWEDLKKTSLPIQQDRLDGGDLMFLGKGPVGEVTVGVEFKKIRDLLSSLRTHRLQGHQLLELQCYDFRFLLVEGEWRHDDAGRVCLRHGYKDWSPAAGGFSGAELDKCLLGLTLRAGVFVKEVSSRRETIRWITSLYRNFTDVDWDGHTSHTGVYRPALLTKPSRFREMMMSLPGVGAKTSKTVESYFKGHPRRAIAARSKEWQLIDGIGPKTASDIDGFLEGE